MIMVQQDQEGKKKTKKLIKTTPSQAIIISY